MPRSLDPQSSPHVSNVSSPISPLSPRLVGGVLALGVIIMMVVVSTFGPAAALPQNITQLLLALLTPAPLIAGLYMLAGLGYGTIFLPICRQSPLARCVAGGAGLALLLTISHLMGCMGLLKQVTKNTEVVVPFLAWLPIVVGLVLLVMGLVAQARIKQAQKLSATPLPQAPSGESVLLPLLATFADPRYRLLWITTPSLAILFVVGTFAPGYLWDSEFGGYDALSYHLQLPQEWLALGVLKPLNHNVYSFLPGYIEGAFMHLGAISFAPGLAQDALNSSGQVATLSVPATGLAAGTGWRLVACQYLHIFFTIFAAYTAARVAFTLSESFVNDPAPSPPLASKPAKVDGGGASLLAKPNALFAGCLAFAIVLTTPWTLAVGSLAYNEMAMLAFFACAMAAACGPLINRIKSVHGLANGSDPTVSPLKTTLLCAILVGAAVCAKPTAIFFCGVPIALLLAFSFHWRAYPKMAAVGVLIGTLMLAPWLIRNGLATRPVANQLVSDASSQASSPSSANPVFPFAASLFPNASGGTGHWNSEQVKRFEVGHSFQGSTIQAAALTLFADPNDPMGRTHRGMLHHQWFLFFPATLIVLGIGAFVCPPGFKLVLRLLLACIACQYLMWLTLTHIQSRFLLPLLIPGAIGLAVAFSCMPTEKHPRWSTRLAMLFVSLQAMACIAVFASQREGEPNLLLGFPASWRNAEVSREVFASDPSQLTAELLVNLPPEQLLALTLEPNAKVTMIGGATPLYMTRETRYNTTWDSWANLDELKAQTRASTSPHYVLVDFSEIARLTRSGIIQPDINSEGITRWLTENTNVIKTWEETGTVLARVKQ